MVCVVGRIRDLILQLSKSSIYSTKPSQDWIAAGVGIVIWAGALFLLRKMAKSDPMLRQVYLRSLKYSQPYYAPRATPFRKNTGTQGKRYERVKK
ncbi:conjugal transfer protein TrbD [Klebsiella pneumoniae]|uniref:conjugal transfer protein TrbD n=1 Tax=Klebsiella pneumoniae TaxID=573 RepID=UPI0018970BAE|nr:conjugal transfer protein TrbD [Klebsiella pneumoniae]MDB7837034.1 conjugal transfer protein TrbD [Klebsiella pneumoniae]